MIIWITGQPGSGKSTLAKALEVALQARGERVARLDGDDLRKQMNNRDFSDAGRVLNVKAGQKLAIKLATEGNMVVAAFVSPHRWLREEFKRQQEVLEVYTYTSVSSPKDRFHVVAYEAPTTNFISLDTGSHDLPKCVEIVLTSLQRHPTTTAP